MSLRVELLGPLRLIVDGQEVLVKRQQVARALVLLAAHTPEPVSQDQLVEHLWGDSLPADPKASLRVALSRLRSTLDSASDALEPRSNGYTLIAETDWADFNEATERAAAAPDDERAREAWSEASDLWRGDLEALADAPMLAALDGRLRQQRERQLIGYAQCLQRLGNHDLVLDILRTEHQASPGNELVATLCADALEALGRKSAAIEVLATTRNHLRDTLGLEPTSDLLRTEDRILHSQRGVERVPVTGTSPSSSIFVGRTRELQQLTDSQPGLTTVRGESGSGKTALVERALASYKRNGVMVLRARASPTPTRPMEPLGEILRQVAQSIPTRDHSEALRSALSRLAPELVEGPVSQPASREGLLALAREVIDTIVTSEHQVVLFIDDAQWLDRSSANLIDSLIDSGNLVIIATSRGTSAAGLEFLTATDRRVRLLDLAPLRLDDVGEMVDLLLPSHPRAVAAQQLLAQSGGNALFLTLLTDLMVEGSLSGSERLPANVLVSVQQRLGALSSQAQRTLEVASIFMDSFPLDVLCDLVPTAENDIESAVAEGLVVPTSQPKRYRFAHTLVAEAAYQLLAEGSRVDLHDEAGRLLEEWGATAAEYALHCGQAASVDPQRAVRSHTYAAREFSSSFDWDTALLHTERGLAFNDEHQLDNPSLHADLLVIAGSCLVAQGNPAGDGLLLAGLRAARGSDDVDILLSGLLALCTRGRMTSAEGPEISEHLATTLQLDLTTAQRAQLLACESTLVSISPLQERGRQAHRQAFEMLERIDDVDAQREVLLRTHLGFPHPADFEKREAATARLRSIAGNDPDLLWEVAFLSFGTAMIRDDAAGAADHLDTMRELTPRIRMRRRDFGLRFSEAAWARFTGELDRAEVLLTEATTIGEEAFADGWSFFTYAALLSSVREMQGRMHELTPIIDDWMDADPSWPTWHVIAAAAAASEGDRERARTELEWLKRDHFGCLSPDISWSAMFSFLTEPVALLGDREAAAMLVNLIEPFAGRNLWNGACIHKSADDALAAYRAVLAE